MTKEQQEKMYDQIKQIEGYCREKFLEPLKAISSGTDERLKAEAGGGTLIVRNNGDIRFLTDNAEFYLDAQAPQESGESAYEPKYSEDGPIKLVMYWKDYKSRLAKLLDDKQAHNKTVQTALDKFQL